MMCQYLVVYSKLVVKGNYTEICVNVGVLEGHAYNHVLSSTDYFNGESIDWTSLTNLTVNRS